LDILKELLDAGGDPNQQDGNGETPLNLAAGAEHGINTILPSNPRERYPQMNLSPNVNAEKIALLLQYKANPNIADNKGRTPLFYVVRGEPAESAYAATKALLTAGADPNVRDEIGRTPLDFANEYTTDPRIKNLLLEHGATESKPKASSSKGSSSAKGEQAADGVTNATPHFIPSRQIPVQEIPRVRFKACESQLRIASLFQ
jgi:ankyrin repeat protein